MLRKRGISPEPPINADVDMPSRASGTEQVIPGPYTWSIK